MKLKQIITTILVLAFPLLAKAQVSTNRTVVSERVASAEDLVSAPVPTNAVTLLAVRTQEVKSVQVVLKMVAHPAARITGGGYERLL